MCARNANPQSKARLQRHLKKRRRAAQLHNQSRLSVREQERKNRNEDSEKRLDVCLEGNRMKIIILDLDNCISDDEWRLQHIDETQPEHMMRYHAYHQLSPFDECKNKSLFTNCEYRIVISTARPKWYEHQTSEWLRRNGVSHQILLMRDHRDLSDVADYKKNNLTWLLKHFSKEDIIKAYDDNKSVIDMYKSQGIPAERVFVNDR